MHPQGRLLGIKETFTPAVAQVAISLSGACDPAVAANTNRILDVLTNEEAVFSTTLERGNKQLNEMLAACNTAKSSVLSGKAAFLLYDSFGFPLELTQELAAQHGIEVSGGHQQGC
jgi:alanyl-tRNA synthetase